MAWLARLILNLLGIVLFFWAMGFIWGIGIMFLYWLAKVAKEE
jgi:hypothetical protein